MGERQAKGGGGRAVVHLKDEELVQGPHLSLQQLLPQRLDLERRARRLRVLLRQHVALRQRSQQRGRNVRAQPSACVHVATIKRENRGARTDPSAVLGGSGAQHARRAP